jgi:glycosyltransferase involved in cell wall biosynthesis
MPEVSVVIPTYNRAQFLDEALQSVFNQTFKDFEVIVVDDGSTDRTKQVLEKYGDRIRYIFQENGGPAKARNRGIKESLGKYIAFLDADDVWFPLKLEKQIRMFRECPELGMVFTENSYFQENGIYRPSMGKKKRLMKGDVASNIFLYSGVATPTVMVRKEIFNKIGLFEEELAIAEDDNLWVRIAVNFKVELIDQLLVEVRNHSQRTTADKKKLSESVLTNIRLLSHRYSGVRERIEHVIPKKVSEVQFDLGYHYLENQDIVRARESFTKGIRWNVWNWRNYAYFLLSLLPKKLIQKLKKFKRKILDFNMNQKRGISN